MIHWHVQNHHNEWFYITNKSSRKNKYFIWIPPLFFFIHACAGENGKKKCALKEISLNNEKLCDILCIGSKIFHIDYDEKEKKETKALSIW